MLSNRYLDREQAVYIHKGIEISYKKDEIFPFAITDMKTEGIMLSEITPKEKDK